MKSDCPVLIVPDWGVLTESEWGVLGKSDSPVLITPEYSSDRFSRGMGFFGCCSENYGNVLWMFGAWIIMIGAAVWYAKRKVMRREKAGAV